MSRRQHAVEREIPADPVYGSERVSKFINNLMRDGKKAVAERILYRALEIVEEKTGQEPMDVFEQAIENVEPVLEVKSRRVGGATYQVPVEVRPERRTVLSMKWLLEAARGRGEQSMAERLSAALMAASRNEGSAIRKKDEIHRMAEANKAFAHFRW